MISPYQSAALEQRRRDLIRAADAARNSRRARAVRTSHRRSVARAPDNQVALRDGSRVVIRPVVAGDAALLADGFSRLSATSRRFRFLSTKRELSPDELRRLTDVDHHVHEAIGALDVRDGRGVGIARYIRSAPGSPDAEVAVTVIDEWQRRGLGTTLLARLTERAQQAGIHAFTALVASDNIAAIKLLRNGKAGVELIHIDIDTIEYEISLGPFAGSLATLA